jgi:putative transposase
MDGKDDTLVTVKLLLELVVNWRQFLYGDVSNEEYELLQRHERTGRPLGSKHFMEQLESQLDRILTPLKGGRPKKA